MPRSRSTSSSIAVLIGTELRLLARDPAPIVVLVGFPVTMMLLLRHAFRSTLIEQGHAGATGAEHAVPGMAVTGATLLLGYIGLSFFRDHGWGTWSRLRSLVSPERLLAGKLVPLALLAVIQQTLLVLGGGWLVGLEVRGPVWQLSLVAVPFSLCIVALGVSLVAVANTLQQLNAMANIAPPLLIGLGGALVPITLLPGWARSVAPGTPSYWAMRGLRSVILGDGGLAPVVGSAAVVVAFTAVFVLLAAWRLSVEEERLAWS